MPKLYNIDESYFNEEKMAVKILTLNSDISSTMNRLIQNETYQCYYKLLIKYLVNQKISKDDVKIIIRRHISLVIYKILSNKKKKCNDNKPFIEKNKNLEEIIKNISISKLLEEVDFDYYSLFCPNYFIELYNAKTYKEIKKACLKIIEEYNKEEDWVEGILKIIFDYFYFNCSFADLNYINHTDLAISHSLFDNNKIRNFEFEVLEAFDSNWKCTQPSNDFYKKAVLGHVINIIFENNNLDYNNKMTTEDESYYKMILNEARKKTIKETLFFVEVYFEEKKAFINKNNINQEFDFMYNNSLYRFTKNGIIKK